MKKKVVKKKAVKQKKPKAPRKLIRFTGTMKVGEAKGTRISTPEMGMLLKVTGKKGALTVRVYVEEGEDKFQIDLEPSKKDGEGYTHLLANGVLNALGWPDCDTMVHPPFANENMGEHIEEEDR